MRYTSAAASTHDYQVARKLVECSPNIGAKDLTPEHVELVNHYLQAQTSPHTKHARAAVARKILRYLAEYQGAPKNLDALVLRVTTPQPRNVTVTTAERSAILAAASPNLRCWLLLCSDLAIRSGTASRLSPENYDRQKGTISFRTKYQSTQTLPVTAELKPLLDRCPNQTIAFVNQLERQGRWGLLPAKPFFDHSTMNRAFKRLLEVIGIKRDLRPHDLRRTTARTIYEATGDLRTVQTLLGHSQLPSTLWYLQGGTAETSLATLELAKLNPLTERTQ